MTIVVVGGGAAGFFAAITCAEQNRSQKVLLLEKTRQLLSKVRISGGGRCNVTHACFDPALLVRNYPRGGQELRGPLSRFQPRDTIEWFEKRGVELKVEEDGRMFPITDRSETIIDCLLKSAKKGGVDIMLEHGIEKMGQEGNHWLLDLTNGQQIGAEKILMATGSAPKMYPLLENLGHTIVPLVPSLFTFNIPDSPFLDLAGISMPDVLVSLPAFKMEYRGPCLLTHWGISGPAVLKLSAWAARDLHSVGYQSTVSINWLPDLKEEEIRQQVLRIKKERATCLIANEMPFEFPKQLWKRFLQLGGIAEGTRWSHISNKEIDQLIQLFRSTSLAIKGKTTYKQEFVTCGGIALNEVNFKTMESRLCPGLYFAGEILNIDGITGGFNFQNAWTTGWIAGNAMATESIS